jgi:hypothetical protein
MILKCDYCSKELFETDKEKMGVIASDASRRGYVVKMPIFFDVPKFNIFCCKECKDKWFDENIPKDKIQEGRESVDKLRQKFQSKEFRKNLLNGLHLIQQIYKKYDNDKR